MLTPTIKVSCLLLLTCLTVVPAARGVEPPENLETAINGALQNHPDIVSAQAKINASRAEYDRVRLEVVRQIVTTWGEIKAKREEVNQLKQEVSREKDPGRLKTLEQGLIRAQAHFEQLATELHYMTQFTGGQALSQPQPGGEFEVQLQVPRSALAQETARKLVRPVTADYSDAPLRDVLGLLNQMHQVNIQIDPNLGIGDENPITLKVDRTSLAGALQAIEDITGYRFVMRDYGILMVDAFAVRDRGFLPVVTYATEHLGIDLASEEAAAADKK